MSERSFFTEDARARVRAAIAEVESRTSAEVVVAVRRSSADYRAADLLFGSVVAFASLLVLLFADTEFPIEWMPLDVALAYGLGVVVSANLWGIKRVLVRPSKLREAVRIAARAAFVDLGITKTSGRNGILVFVSMLERRVEVVADVGVDRAALGAPFRDAVAALEAAVARETNLDRFIDALRSLGPILGGAMPRAADDVNELPDEVVSA